MQRAEVLLDEARYVNAALKSARGLAARQRADGFLAGTYGDGWTPQATYCCLTGLAQSALNWQRLDQQTGRDEFGGQVMWAKLLGRAALAAGENGYWPMVTEL